MCQEEQKQLVPHAAFTKKANFPFCNYGCFNYEQSKRCLICFLKTVGYQLITEVAFSIKMEITFGLKLINITSYSIN